MDECVELYLDCRGMQCPLPIVQISRIFKTMAPGQLLRVDASDPAFRADLDAWLEMRQEQVLEFSDTGGYQRAVLRKAVAI